MQKNKTLIALLNSREPVTQLVIITPEDASFLMGLNIENNRNIRQHRVTIISDDLRSGRWTINGDTIKLSISGKLLDGQHRLTAIIQTGIAASTFVTGGLPEEAFVQIDTGRAPRTTANVLHMKGITGYATVASAIPRIQNYFDGHAVTSGFKAVYSTSQITELAEIWPDVVEKVSAIASELCRIKVIPPSAVASLFYLFGKASPDLADAFLIALRHGNGPKGLPLGKYQSFDLLSERLNENLRSTRRESSAQLVIYCIKAFNAELARRPLKSIRAHPSDHPRIRIEGILKPWPKSSHAAPEDEDEAPAKGRKAK